MTTTFPAPDELLTDVSEEAPLTEADRQAIRDLDLSSCDFVGDAGCVDPDCWRCHSPIGPEHLRALAKNIATAAMLCRAWSKRDDDPAWHPGCRLAAGRDP